MKDTIFALGLFLAHQLPIIRYRDPVLFQFLEKSPKVEFQKVGMRLKKVQWKGEVIDQCSHLKKE